MKSALTVPLILMLAATCAQAQGTRIFRCGNSYTNDAQHAAANGCKPVEGGNVTIVEGTKVNGAAATRVAANTPQAPGGQRIESQEQKARDADARLILETELKKAEARQAELQKEWNNGEPERKGDERNYQKYLERQAELKASIARNENDIAGLRRELSRLGGAPTATK